MDKPIELRPPVRVSPAERPEETLTKSTEHLRAKGYSKRTVEGYGFYSRQFACWLAERGIGRLDALQPGHLADYQAFIAARRGARGAPLAGYTRLGIAVAVAQFARFLVRTGRARRELADDLTLPRVPRKLPDNVLPLRKMERLLAAPRLDDPGELRDRALMELLYATGLRQSEALDLRLEDVDFVADEVRVRAGKGGTGRVVPLGRRPRR
jgi:integrase/recombinase XerD